MTDKKKPTAKAAGTRRTTKPSTTQASSTAIGAGGETHQQSDEANGTPVLTTNHGVPVSDDQNSLRLGERGPLLLEDFVLREKIFHFDHERIPERIVHARGSGAHGHFVCTDPIPELTKADLFQRKGETVPVFVRFSTVAGGAGSVDTPRDVRGFAVKFYTQQGNWDLVGNNIPVFFIQDAMKFPDIIHAVKMEADRGYPQAASAHDTFWDFVSLAPETTHMLMWVMSDRTLPRSLRMMDGFGVHTFRLVNAEGTSTFVKFHWRAALGVQSTLWDEAVKIAGADPDFHRRDLFDTIDSGAFPEWELAVQVFDEAFADAQSYDVLDATKLIPEEDVPLRVVGRLVLDRNPDNFFAETEQVAFLPSNVVPGIDFSEDPLLHGRLFSYLDTQKSRLGTTNFVHIPVNAPKCPVANFLRDGMMQTQVPTGRANYEPNSLEVGGELRGPRESSTDGFATLVEPSSQDDSHRKLRARPERFADHFTQARLFWRSQDASGQAHIVSAFGFELSKVELEHVRERMLANLGAVDAELADRVAATLGQRAPDAAEPRRPVLDVEPCPSLSMSTRTVATLEGRSVSILVDDGSDNAAIDTMRVALETAGATVKIIAPKINVIGSGGQIAADGQLAGSPSVLVDAIALILTEEAAAGLCHDSAAVQFVTDAFVHLKAIGHDGAAAPLLDRAGVVADEGVTGLDDNFVTAAAQRFWDREPSVRPAP